MASNLGAVARKLGGHVARWLESTGFRGAPGKFALVPDPKGRLFAVLLGVVRDDLYAVSVLPHNLPPGDYRFDKSGIDIDAQNVAFGWGVGAYRFSRYKKKMREPASLFVDKATLRDIVP